MIEQDLLTGAVACIWCRRWFGPEGGFLESHQDRDHWTGLLW